MQHTNYYILHEIVILVIATFLHRGRVLSLKLPLCVYFKIDSFHHVSLET